MTTTAEYPAFTQTKQHDSGVQVSTNVSVADTTRMSVDSDGAAHIMSLLTDLYSDPEGTVIREYISNALDSHAAAGNLHPVDVTLPSSLSKNFIVQDYGTGMSAEDIRSIYASYGRSTKRTDMTQVGAYGLGCKSALTLVQSFTLVAVRNGERTVAIISRGEDGVGEIKITSISATSAENGVKVTIPVVDIQKFLAKAEKFFFTLPKNSVLVNGSPITDSLYSDNYILMEGVDTYISRSWSYTSSSSWYAHADNVGAWNVVMGGVSYKISFSEIDNEGDYATRNTPLWKMLSSGVPFRMYSIIPIASIDLTPSREEIRYSQRTKKFLVSLVKALSSKFVAQVIKNINEAPTHREAIVRYKQYSNHLNRYGSMKDNPITDWNGLKYAEARFQNQHKVVSFTSSNNTRMHDEIIIDLISLVDAKRSTSIYYITTSLEGDEYGKFCERIRRNFSQFLRRDEEEDEEDDNNSLYIFFKAAPDNVWFKNVGLFTEITEQEILDGAMKWRKYRRTVGAGNRDNTKRVTGYQYISLVKNAEKEGVNELFVGLVPAKEITKDDLLVEGNSFEMNDILQNGKIMRSLATNKLITQLAAVDLYDVRIICLPPTRKIETLFARSGIEIPFLATTIRTKTLEFWNNLSKEAQTVVAINHGYTTSRYADMQAVYSFLIYLNRALETAGETLDSLGDPDLSALFTAYRDAQEHTEKMQKHHLTIMPGGAILPKDVKMVDFKERYPLAYHASRGIMDGATIQHSIKYIKMINNEGKDA